MQRQFKIVCRGSKLSLAQARIFQQKLKEADPAINTAILVKETKGDANQEVPLHEIEGKDFFTKDIQDSLLSGEADFAVHSLKDVSGENFFDGTHFAIIEREDPRDVAIFSSGVLERLSNGQVLTLGTSSPRRVEMATRFLRGALPVFHGKIPFVTARSIRGNVDTRLQKLSRGDFDGVILACAGLNRLLRSEPREEVTALLADKRIMFLPLFECPPAPGQGAIVAETVPGNRQAVQLLYAVNNATLAHQVSLERRIAHLYGSGCHQKFGAIYMEAGGEPMVYAAGVDRSEQSFVSAYSEAGDKIELPAVFTQVAEDDPFFEANRIKMISRKSIGSLQASSGLKLWVDETAAWYEAAAKGYWVEGSLEGLGRFFNEYTIKGPLANITATTVRERSK